MKEEWTRLRRVWWQWKQLTLQKGAVWRLGLSSELFERELGGGLVGAADSSKESWVTAQCKQSIFQKRVVWRLDLSSQLFERELGGGSDRGEQSTL